MADPPSPSPMSPPAIRTLPFMIRVAVGPVWFVAAYPASGERAGRGVVEVGGGSVRSRPLGIASGD